jgi:hypothetical protein
MDWLRKHTETVVVLSAIFGTFLWMNGKFAGIEKDLFTLRLEIKEIKTVMIMNGHYPKELIASDDV